MSLDALTKQLGIYSGVVSIEEQEINIELNIESDEDGVPLDTTASPEAEMLAKMNDKIITPELIFIMTTPFEVFVKRRDARDAALNNARDYIEKDVHDDYVERYLTYADLHPSTCAVIDCLGSQTDVIGEVISTFDRRIRQ